jgi:glycosyltransferase involved in cell wall biosynthesis
MSSVFVLFDYQIFFHQEYGGVSRYFVELATHLAAMSDTRVGVCAGRHHNGYVAELPKTVSVRGWRVPRGPNRAIEGLRLLGNAANYFWQASRSNATHLHQTYFYELFRPVSRATRIVTVYDMTHELFPSQFAAAERASAAKRRAVAQADHVICISESTGRDLMRLFDVPASKVTTIPLGLSSALAGLANGTAGSEMAIHGRPYLLFVGKRGGYKNFDTMLRAYASGSELSSELDILCFGGGPITDDERALMSRLGIADGRVHHVGGDDIMLARAYRQAQFLVYPSLYEGFGLPPLEAMAFGCPVACGNASSLPEVVGESAVTFDAADDGAMAAALLSLASDAALRDRCRHDGRRRAAEFTWQRAAEMTRDVYVRTA